MDKSICYSHIGKRTNHEDNFLIDGNYLTSDSQKQMPDNCCYFIRQKDSSSIHLFVVSDGMGGHSGGEVASRICVEKLSLAYINLKNYNTLKEMVTYLQTVIAEINDIVYEMGCNDLNLKGMGATLVLFLVYKDKYAILNIGDSRAYYFNDNSIIQITKDHTEGQRMIDLGILTRKELFGFPARKNLNRYIGYGQNGYVMQADEYYPVIKKGVILLCSDGITDFISDVRIAEILSKESNLEQAGKQIVDEAVKSHNADNATIILISF